MLGRLASSVGPARLSLGTARGTSSVRDGAACLVSVPSLLNDAAVQVDRRRRSGEGDAWGTAFSALLTDLLYDQMPSPNPEMFPPRASTDPAGTVDSGG